MIRPLRLTDQQMSMVRQAGVADSVQKLSDFGFVVQRDAVEVGARHINTTLYDKLTCVFLRDSAPVVGFISLPFVMVLNPSVPAKTVAELTAYANAIPVPSSSGLYRVPLIRTRAPIGAIRGT